MTTHSYYVVMIDFGKRGLEAIVDPEITRRGVVARITAGEYTNIAFIHHIEGGYVFDCTDELMTEAGVGAEVAA
jgi:hypothetical protein